MSKPVPITSAVALFAAALTLISAVASPVWATKRCPPLVVQNGGGECKVVNYSSTVTDTNVSITIYDHNGDVLTSCPGQSIQPKGQIFCGFNVTNTTDVSCEVTGENGSARVSFVARIPGTFHTGAAVECR